MSFLKLGEAIQITSESIVPHDAVEVDQGILDSFKKYADSLKIIAPKAKDFLYFTAIMMHAAEASLLDGSGKFKKDASGKEVEARWEHNGESMKWICSDSQIMPYKNSNNDIFPEPELLKAYKKWVGRPLCIDHKSDSVDGIRGLIVDTYYDYPNKRVIALCALDKINYPDLARKVASGYATSVSMGTAVGRAICSDCGRVARTESEYCSHMKARTCYGEINAELNPIELSIVVNGADGQAKIRHIVAAKDQIARYVDMKKDEFTKISSEKDIDINNLLSIKQDLDRVTERLETLMSSIKQEKIEEEEVKTASVNDQKDFLKLADALNGIQNSLQELKDNINKFSNKEDIKMGNKKEAYFQGGGGVNEPTPGQVKYPKEDSDSIRDTEDRQMTAVVQTGSDGMFPGDAEKKRALQRLAEKERRQLMREAALEKAKKNIQDKQAYFQGGGGVNEPTPGKPKYPKEDSDKIRDKEDRQMVGAPPFPGVGKVDGLYGDDLKVKQMLSRAKLTAKFIKASNSDGTNNRDASRWEVYANDKLVMSGTVKDITDNKADLFYDKVASKDFGKQLISMIRAEQGFNRVASILKSAQQAPMPPAQSAPVPMPAGQPMAPEVTPEQLPPMEGVDEGGAGDPVAVLPEKLDEAEAVLADIREGVNALMEESDTQLEDFGDLPTGAELPPGAPPVETKASITNKFKAQRKLAKGLAIAMSEVGRELTSLVEEMKYSKGIYDSGKVGEAKSTVNHLTAEVLREVDEQIKEAKELMRSLVKLAKATEVLEKQASDRKELLKKAQVTVPPTPERKEYLTPTPSAHKPEDAVPAKPAEPEKAGGKSTAPASQNEKPETVQAPVQDADDNADDDVLMPPEDFSPEAIAAKEKIAETPPEALNEFQKEVLRSDSVLLETYCAKYPYCDKESLLGVKQDTNDLKVKPNADGTLDVVASQFDLTTKSGRAAYRDALDKAAKASGKYSPVLDQAHPGGGVTTKLDTKPTGDLAKVETLEEQQAKMLEVVSGSVKKAAEDIQKHVVAGNINPSKDFDSLVSLGVDPAAIAYWKKYYGQIKGEGSQFAADLLKDHVQKKASEEIESHKVKLARAWELTYDMVDKGLVTRERSAIRQQVKEIMAFDDNGFESMKRWVDRQSVMEKKASMPVMGGGTDSAIMLTPTQASDSHTAFVEALTGLWANKK